MLPRRRVVSRTILALLAPILIVGWGVTLHRSPTFWPDAQLYASIARARQLHGSGVPTLLSHSPLATDHIRFYGPVFFELAARSFAWFGVAKWSFRLVSLFGALLFTGAGAWLAGELTGRGDRALLSMALIALTPELAMHARTGSMDSLAIGLELLALTIFVRGVVRQRAAVLHGAAAGVVLALAALTTPRTFPFVGAFLAAAAIAVRSSERRQTAAVQWLTAGIALTLIMSAWAVASHGSVWKWVRFVAYIGMHEDTDVAILPTAHRVWSVSPQVMVTPLVGAAGAILAGWRLRRWPASPLKAAATFAVAAGWITFIATGVLMNLTLEVGTYLALPLFAVVVALPLSCFESPDVRGRAYTQRAACALLACGLAMQSVRYARIAAVWRRADPTPLVAFLEEHGVRGGEVAGPEGLFFFAVERAGGYYRSTEPDSWADWARWVPVIEPAATGPSTHTRHGRDRFLLWPVGESLPDEYACARGHTVAVYTPPSFGALARLGRIARGNDTGYPTTVLYALPDKCPLGYDPTADSRTIPAD